ncbi:hypothetical protein [Microcoleus sp. S13_C5]|uniref:hypothetical protein n=1 Tax=Microcoleus sp. S13_C5 TaxID=3055411 RepID=UPI002FD714D7
MELAADFNDIFWERPETEFQPLLDFEEETLNAVPYNDLADLTREIKLSFVDYVRQGVMLYTIRRYRLYKRQFKDFAEYCKLALGRSPIYCKRIIEAAHTTIELIKAGFKILPTSVSQALPLVKFTKMDDTGHRELEGKWQSVIETEPPEHITAAKIAEMMDDKKPEERAKQIKVSGKAYKMLEQKAAAADMTVSEYLEMLIGTTEPPDDEEPTIPTPEQEEILDQLDAEFQKDATAEAIGKADKPVAGFGNQKLSKSYQKAISPIRSDKTSDST